MAISLRGVVSGGSDNTNCTLNLPVGSAQGDLVIAAYAMSSSTDSDLDMSMATAGYTEIADLFANDSRETNFGVFYKFLGAVPDTTVEFATSGTQDIGAVAIVLSGVDRATPFDVAAVTATGINSETPDPPSITPVSNDVWIIALAGNSDGNGTPTAPTNYGNLAYGRPASANDTTAMVATRVLTSPAAEDPGTFGGIPADTTQAWCAVTLALRPAKVISANAGTVTVTGPAATLKVGRRIVASAGSVAVTGQAATLKRGHSLVAASGAVAVTGTAATLSISSQRRMVAQPGSVLATGSSAVLAVTRRVIAAQPGSVVVSGQVATLKRGCQLRAATGGVTVTGTGALLKRPSDVFANGGILLMGL